MRPIVTDGAAWSIGPSVMIANPVWTDRDVVWDAMCGGTSEACVRGAHWRHLANTIEPSMCGGDATFCQIIWPLVKQVVK